MQTIIDGFLKFKREVFPQKKALFRELAASQSPTALFITCGDSRVVPDLITQSQPGDLFICRTVGNQIPPYSGSAESGVASSVEYAVQALKVQDVIVCGHSDCGAMKAVLKPERLAMLPATRGWLQNAEAARSVTFGNYTGVSEEVMLHLLTEENVIAQLENLKTHPSVATRLARGDLRIHGWVYHIHSGEITAYDAAAGRFRPLDQSFANASATPPSRLKAASAASMVGDVA